MRFTARLNLAYVVLSSALRRKALFSIAIFIHSTEFRSKSSASNFVSTQEIWRDGLVGANKTIPIVSSLYLRLILTGVRMESPGLQAIACKFSNHCNPCHSFKAIFLDILLLQKALQKIIAISPLQSRIAPKSHRKHYHRVREPPLSGFGYAPLAPASPCYIIGREYFN